MRGVFVTGTDTGVGKTLVSAVLVRAWSADYFKPLQTGLAEEDGDTLTVAGLAGLDHERIHAPAYGFAAPLSPHAAAELEGAEIDFARLRLPESPGPIVVEGAGGVLVPINRERLMIDLISALGLPAMVVARSTLGTINHTLLTLQALRARRCPVAGVVLSGPLSHGNAAAIRDYGQTRILLQIPPLDAVTPDVVAQLAGQTPSLDALEEFSEL